MERPILFSAPMVRAILEGRKTQTRRVVKPIPQMVSEKNIVTWDGDAAALMRLFDQVGRSCPYGQTGDRLWVRETWMDLLGTGIERTTGDRSRYAYRADTPTGSYGDEARKGYGLKWRPSIHMPRAASRILLEITAVRVERLQDISEADAQAEGVENSLHLRGGRFARENFEHLWLTINGDGSWEVNPWVWVVEFKRVEAHHVA